MGRGSQTTLPGVPVFGRAWLRCRTHLAASLVPSSPSADLSRYTGPAPIPSQHPAPGPQCPWPSSELMFVSALSTRLVLDSRQHLLRHAAGSAHRPVTEPLPMHPLHTHLVFMALQPREWDSSHYANQETRACVTSVSSQSCRGP